MEWISVKDRPPEENNTFSEFIVMIKGAKRPTTLEYQGSEWFVDEDGSNYAVTHWMPPPDPPANE